MAAGVLPKRRSMILRNGAIKPLRASSTSGGPLRLPMVAQGLNTLQQFVPHALVVTFKMIVGQLFSKLPRLDYGVHAIQISSFPVICGVLKHVAEPYLTVF